MTRADRVRNLRHVGDDEPSSQATRLEPSGPDPVARHRQSPAKALQYTEPARTRPERTTRHVELNRSTNHFLSDTADRGSVSVGFHGNASQKRRDNRADFTRP
jgi:hypothetical protein